jgi:hypothetical protein
MTLERFCKNSRVVGLAASVLLLGGWFGNKEKPLLPASAVAAVYTTDTTKNVPVMKAFERVLDEQWSLLSERMQASKPGSGLKMPEDPFETYLAVDRKEIEWSLVTLGALARSVKMEDTPVPDMAWTFCGTFNKEKTLAALTQQLAAKHPGFELSASTLNGTPIWTLKSASFGTVQGLNPCMAFSGKRLLLIASNQKALGNLLDLYAGKVAGLSKDASLSRVLAPNPNLISRLMVVNINEALHTLTTEAERAQKLADPRMNAVANSLREMTIETRVIPGREAAEVVVSMACADEGNAQALNELCLTAKTSALFLLGMASQQKPELKAGAAWLSKINSRVDGKQTMLWVECSPQDLTICKDMM